MRSVGKTVPQKADQRRFKKCVFDEPDRLTCSMDRGTLTEDEILSSIRSIASGVRGVSFGQAQKPINVVLKVHFYLKKDRADPIGRQLFCPLDSIILARLHEQVSLAEMNEKEFREAQSKIAEQSLPEIRLSLDDNWDKQHLSEEGLLENSS